MATASEQNPIYTVYMVVGKTKYNITPAVVDIDLSEQENQIAQTATIRFVNVRIKGGKTMCQTFDVRQRVFIYANDGTKKEEVFRGWNWTKIHDSDMEETVLTMKCYDNLIYLQESQDSMYFSKGANTKSVMNKICNKWGINLNYTYSTITHDKLVLKGALSDFILNDILNKVKDRTGKDYVVRSAKDVMYVMPVGSNKKKHRITKKGNAVNVRSEKTMDGMVTKVVILGKAEEKSEKVPVVATVSGETSKYGTLQQLQDKDEDTSLANAKKEAQNTINEKGKPFREYEVQAVDIPWIRKGDMVHVEAGHIISQDLIAVSVERSISNTKKTMTLTLKDP